MQQVIIAGGRDFNNQHIMAECINELMESNWLDTNFILSCGMAKGADKTAKDLLSYNDFSIQEYIPNWADITVPGAVIKHNQHGAYNAMAGFIRNQEMANDSCTLIAFWDGTSRGTDDMIKRMLKMNKRVRVFDYLGNLMPAYSNR